MAANRISIKKLLSIGNLSIPKYQRPYKWDRKNIEELLQDISVAIEESRKYPQDYRYRIGTVLLHNNKAGGTLDIVDGQQRVISLTLLYLFLDPTFRGNLMDKHFTDRVTKHNIRENYYFIRQWFALKGHDERKAFLNAFESVLEVVVIEVEEQAEAFQLFDSQNSRGRSLFPHDLLKAYHLREMKNNLYEMEHAVKAWEEKEPSDIKDMFNDYLFAICNWAQRRKTSKFSDKQIETFKGTDLEFNYTYSLRAFRSAPYYQINEPFLAGQDFFDYVEHYLQLLSDLKRMLKADPEFSELLAVIDNQGYNRSTGFRYCEKLFYCVLLCYYDRFHSMDKMAVTRLFLWAFMIRVDMLHLGLDTINLYATGSGEYTNQFPMFSLIVNARKHTDISNLHIVCKRNGDNWSALADELKRINGR